ncbi:MAG TPA: hypothetical protein VN408_20010 [Actinoplanes sp.]|nr:hypothetical protein [Actinoplanes sp.]
MSSGLGIWDGLDPGMAGFWRRGLGYNRAAPVDVLVSLLEAGETGFLFRTDLPVEVVDAAAGHPDARVRHAAMDCGHLSDAQWESVVAATPKPGREYVADYAREWRAARQPPTGSRVAWTPEELAAWAAEVPDINPDTHTNILSWVADRHPDPEAMRLLAASPKLLVRRSVARARRLPADVVTVLARDPDRAVRLFLAESCDDAPAEMLLEVASWWDGSLSYPGRPANHPNFPHQGLLRYETDPNPLLRVLALLDGDATAAVAERLGTDPEPEVRRAAAGDTRLSPESARRLAADDDQGVRWTAWRNPSLPAETQVALLSDAGSAEHAVRNPAIPVPVLRWMAAPQTS